MPSVAAKACLKCGTATENGAARCKKHAVALKTGSGQQNNGQYGRAWRKKRRIQMLRHPMCEHCRASGTRTRATEVDHIVPLSDGGTHRYSNLQSLCGSCHRRKTHEDVRRRGGRG